MTSGSIGAAQIEQVLILLRAFGEIMGVGGPTLEDVLGKARKDLFAGKDERPVIPPEPPIPPA